MGIGLFLFLLLLVLWKRQKVAKLFENYRKKICAINELEWYIEEMLVLSADDSVSDDYILQKAEPYFRADTWPFDSVPISVLPRVYLIDIYDNKYGARHMMTRELLTHIFVSSQVTIPEVRLWLQNKISK